LAGCCQSAHEIQLYFVEKLRIKHHFGTQWPPSVTTATIPEDTSGISISSHHLEPIMASGAQKRRLDEDKSPEPSKLLPL